MTVAIARTSAAKPSRRDRDMLFMSTFVLVTSFLLTIRPDGRVILRGLPAFPVPDICFTRAILHIDCPACGLTRSFISLAQGNIIQSLHYNRCGIVLRLSQLTAMI